MGVARSCEQSLRDPPDGDRNVTVVGRTVPKFPVERPRLVVVSPRSSRTAGSGQRLIRRDVSARGSKWVPQRVDNGCDRQDDVAVALAFARIQARAGRDPRECFRSGARSGCAAAMPRTEESRRARRHGCIAREMRKPNRATRTAAGALLLFCGLRLLVRHGCDGGVGRIAVTACDRRIVRLTQCAEMPRRLWDEPCATERAGQPLGGKRVPPASVLLPLVLAMARPGLHVPDVGTGGP
jgi:hypothetical protein